MVHAPHTADDHGSALPPRTGQPLPGGKVNRATFAEYQRRATEHAKSMYRAGNQPELYEQAVPSYIHGNPLMRHLFWERMWRVVKYVQEANDTGGTVLDFGCGVGVLLPLLSACGFPVAAVDIDIAAAPRYLEPFGVKPVFLRQPDYLDSLPEGSFAVITALDVLEHLPDLEVHLKRLRRLLAPGGSLVICGPTENLIYKLGRKVAGFSGHYHVHNVYDIRRAAQPLFAIEHISTLVPVVPLFEIFSCVRRSAATAGVSPRHA